MTEKDRARFEKALDERHTVLVLTPRSFLVLVSLVAAVASGWAFREFTLFQKLTAIEAQRDWLWGVPDQRVWSDQTIALNEDPSKALRLPKIEDVRREVNAQMEAFYLPPRPLERPRGWDGK
jgi:hypothetical protein